LLVETNHEILRHLEDCPACRRELAARCDLRTQLRCAVKNAPEAQINPAFASRLTNDLQAAALRPTFFEKFKTPGFFGNPSILAAAFALLILMFGIWFLLRSVFNPNNIAVSNQSNEMA